jgi:hypothetical protein
MNGMRSGPVNIETFLFSVIHRTLTDKEEEAVVDLVRSASHLRTISLTYMPPPVLPHKPEFWIENDDPDDEESSDETARVLQRPQTEPTVYEAAAYKERNNICRFPLARLLRTRNETLRSIALTQDPEWKMSDEDLAYIGIAVPYLVDLAITFPGLEMDKTETKHNADLIQLLERLGDTLMTYPRLKCLQLIVDSSEYEWLNDEDLRISLRKKVARKAIVILSNRGLRLDFFTLATRFPEHDYVYCVSDCHLRVRSDPTQSEAISEKALKRRMNRYGDLQICNFEELVKAKTGFACGYERG